MWCIYTIHVPQFTSQATAYYSFNLFQVFHYYKRPAAGNFRQTSCLFLSLKQMPSLKFPGGKYMFGL